MATAKESLLRLLMDQAQAGASAKPLDFNKRLSGAIARGQMENMAHEEGAEDRWGAMGLSDAQIAERRGAPNLYGIQGARRANQMELEDANRMRTQQQALQDIRFGNEQSQLKALLAKGGNTPQAAANAQPQQDQSESYADPFVQSAMMNSVLPTAVATRSQGLDAATNAMGVDFRDPMQMSAVKSVVQDALKTGKPVDAAVLRETIQQKVQAVRLAKLTDEGKELDLRNKIKASKQTLDDNIKKSGLALSKPVINKLQTQVIEGNKLYNQLERIKASYDPKFLEYAGSGKVFALVKAQKAGQALTPEQKELVKQYSRFEKTTIASLLQQLKALSGAQVSDKEREYFEKSFLSMSFSPAQFEAALEGLLAATRMDIIANENMLSKNDLGAGKLEYLRKNNEEYAKLEQTWNSAKDMAKNVYMSSLNYGVNTQGETVVTDRNKLEELKAKRDKLRAQSVTTNEPQPAQSAGPDYMPGGASNSSTGNQMVDQFVGQYGTGSAAPAQSAGGANQMQEAVKNMSPRTRQILLDYLKNQGEYSK